MDILSWLGARALGTSSAVKPIIPPLFLARAPVVEGMAASVGVDKATDPQTMPAEWRDAETPARLPFDRPEARAEQSHAALNTPVSLPVADVPKRREADSTPDVLRPLAVDPARSTRDGMQDLRLQRPSIQPHTHGTSPDIASRADQRSRASAVSRQRDDGIRPAAARESDPVGSMPAASASVPLVPREGTLPDVAAALEWLRALRETVAAPRLRRDPVVRVSIGRIEVRSAPATAPEPVLPQSSTPVPARALPPRLTLAEYLARQRGAR